jgi:hypothetical protein
VKDNKREQAGKRKGRNCLEETDNDGRSEVRR